MACALSRTDMRAVGAPRPHGQGRCGCTKCRAQQMQLEALVDADLADATPTWSAGEDAEGDALSAKALELPVFVTRYISASVGAGGANQQADVRAVQQLLNTFILAQRLPGRAILTVDGKIGPNTINAIRDFQRIFVGMRNPDGRVDAGGRTLEKLNGSVLQPTVRAGGGTASPRHSSSRGTTGNQAEQKLLIQRLCLAVEATGTLRGFNSFALATAYTESRWSLSAHNDKPSEVSASCRLYRGSAGRGFFAQNRHPESHWCIGSGGWFGLMPATGLAAGGTKGPFARSDPRLIFDPAASVVMLADLVRRLVQNYGADSWLAVRRGMASPGLVADRAEANKRSRHVRDRFEEALRVASVPVSFMNERPDLSNFSGAGALLPRVREAAAELGLSVAEGELSTASRRVHSPPLPAAPAHNSPNCECRSCRLRQLQLEALIDSDLDNTWDRFLPALITRDIKASVGSGGVNQLADVRAVQQLLNTFILAQRLPGRAMLSVDGKIGPNTIGAIRDFQRIFVGMSSPDGRVDPGGQTLEKLNGSVAQPAVSSTPVPSTSGGAGCTVSDSVTRCGSCEARDRRVVGAPPSTLVTVPSALHRPGRTGQKLEATAADAYRRMVEASRSDGIAAPYLLLMSGFRDYARQARLWRDRLLGKFTTAGCGGQRQCIGMAIDATSSALRTRPQPHQLNEWLNRFQQELRNRNCGQSCNPAALVADLRRGTAPPGRSPHHTGRAVDIYVGQAPGYSAISTKTANVSVQRRTDAFRWLVCNAARFGFHPLHNEPWHWEYNP
jgi:peptidoglycan hydrolase-like protein with peptidoglycan-binding domain